MVCVNADDHSRVKLERSSLDYINASLVVAADADRSYILTQVRLSCPPHCSLNTRPSTSHCTLLLLFLKKVMTHQKVFFRKKLARAERVLIVKVYFERRKIVEVYVTHVQDFFRKRLSKENIAF